MEKLVIATDSQAASFCVIDSSHNEQPDISTFLYRNFDPQCISEYLEGMASEDPTIQAILKNPDQKIFHDSQYISEAEKHKHVYYNWHKQFGDTWHRVAGMTNPAPNIQSGLTVHRTRSVGDYSPRDLDIFRTIFGHIDRATQMSYRLGVLQTAQHISENLFHQSPFGIVLLTTEGHVVFANQMAEKISTTNDGISLAASGLNFMKQSDGKTFQRLVAQALNMLDRRSFKASGIMSAARPSGKRPYTVSVMPLAQSANSFAKYYPSVCVVIADPERQVMPALQHLQTLYRLTQAESKLTAELMNGEDLKTAAENLGIGYQTARTQLTAIFRKTSTKRQSELVKLLFSAVPYGQN